MTNDDKATKTISELMPKQSGLLSLWLEQLLAPASPWEDMEGIREKLGAFKHITLNDFQKTCEWEEQWYAQFHYGVDVCPPYKKVTADSKEEADSLAYGDFPDFSETDEEWYEHFQENIPTRNFRDCSDVRVNIWKLRLKEEA